MYCNIVPSSEGGSLNGVDSGRSDGGSHSMVLWCCVPEGGMKYKTLKRNKTGVLSWSPSATKVIIVSFILNP
jgi:hypothetical protein